MADYDNELRDLVAAIVSATVLRPVDDGTGETHAEKLARELRETIASYLRFWKVEP